MAASAFTVVTRSEAAAARGARGCDGGPLQLPQAAAQVDRLPFDAVHVEQLAALLFANKVCKHVKSNAIVYAKDGATVGIGSMVVDRLHRVPRILGADGAGIHVGNVLAPDLGIAALGDDLAVAAVAELHLHARLAHVRR